MSLTDDEVAELAARMQLKESVRLFNTMAQSTFRTCVHSFRGNTLTEQERECLTHSVEKYLKVSRRVQARIAELQLASAKPAGQ